MSNRMKQFSIMVFSAMMLTACTGDSTEEVEENLQPDTSASDDASNEQIPSFEMEKDSIIQLDPGFLTVEYLSPKEYEVDNYEQTEQEILQEFRSLMEEQSDDLSAQEWLDFIVHTLGADYEEPISRIDDYEFIFEELTLPDGRPIQDLEDEEIQEEMEKEVNVAILLDSSGSMAAEVEGGQKMDLAKDAIAYFVQHIPEEVNVMVQAYGHLGDNTNDGKQESCEGIENVYPLSPIEPTEFYEAVDPIEPTGWTPLADAIEAAKEDLIDEADENSINFIYVISDGIETCDGDPVAVAETLPDAGIDFEVNILGFDIADDEHEQLQEIANVSDGEYSSVYTGQELDEEITNSWLDNLSDFAWIIWARDGINESIADSMDMTDEVRELRDDANEVRNQERGRIDEAVQMLNDERLEADTSNELRRLIQDRLSIVNEAIDESYSEKRTNITETRNEISDILRTIRNENVDDL
ncbi:VWA domain-containing protein [Geomicrobium sp. JSM 1781026]|uniref:VWA domain-containing protein n=1 Tax=Geomicrobium sp. JSM 1781026 TaxID=3344580 RepID=UPI0035C021FB